MSGVSQGRRVQTNCRERVEKIKMTSKLKGVVNSGKVWRKPVYWPSGVRHKGSVILVRALVLNYRNLRWRCKGKGASVKSEADNTNAPSRDGATRTVCWAVPRSGGLKSLWCSDKGHHIQKRG